MTHWRLQRLDRAKSKSLGWAMGTWKRHRSKKTARLDDRPPVSMASSHSWQPRSKRLASRRARCSWMSAPFQISSSELRSGPVTEPTSNPVAQQAWTWPSGRKYSAEWGAQHADGIGGRRCASRNRRVRSPCRRAKRRGRSRWRRSHRRTSSVRSPNVVAVEPIDPPRLHPKWPRCRSAGSCGGDQRPRSSRRIWCPRQDSNLRTRLRRAMLYPLSYEGGDRNPRRSGRPPQLVFRGRSGAGRARGGR